MNLPTVVAHLVAERSESVMREVNCYIPIKVRIVGELSDADLEQLGNMLVRQVSQRIAFAEWTVLSRNVSISHGGSAEFVRDACDPSRSNVASGRYQIPPYKDQGTLKEIRIFWLRSAFTKHQGGLLARCRVHLPTENLQWPLDIVLRSSEVRWVKRLFVGLLQIQRVITAEEAIEEALKQYPIGKLNDTLEHSDKFRQTLQGPDDKLVVVLVANDQRQVTTLGKLRNQIQQVEQARRSPWLVGYFERSQSDDFKRAAEALVGLSPGQLQNVRSVLSQTIGITSMSKERLTASFDATWLFPSVPINPGNSFPITCGPWNPTASDAVLNGGHVCIAAHCYPDDGSDGSPLSLRPAPFANEFSFLCDTHHGQRNFAVVFQSAAQAGMCFHMILAHPLPVGGFIGTIEIQRTLSKTALVKAMRNQFRSMSDIPYLKGGTRELETSGARLVMPRNITLAHAIDHGRYLLHLGDNKFTPIFFSRFRPDFAFEVEGVGVGQKLGVKLKEGQANPLTAQLNLDASEQPGAIHAFDLLQRDEAGAIVGGARFLVILTS